MVGSWERGARLDSLTQRGTRVHPDLLPKLDVVIPESRSSAEVHEELFKGVRAVGGRAGRARDLIARALDGEAEAVDVMDAAMALSRTTTMSLSEAVDAVRTVQDAHQYRVMFGDGKVHGRRYGDSASAKSAALVLCGTAVRVGDWYAEMVNDRCPVLESDGRVLVRNSAHGVHAAMNTRSEAAWILRQVEA